jgi:hypothetical protein
VSIGGGTPERLAQLVEIDLVEEMADRRLFSLSPGIPSLAF